MAFEEMKFNLLLRRLSKVKYGEYIKLDLQPWEHGQLIDSESHFRKELMTNLQKIDWSDFNFSYLNPSYMDFTGMKGVQVKDWNIYRFKIESAKFNGVEFLESLRGGYIDCDFTGSIGAKMCPRISNPKNISVLNVVMLNLLVNFHF